MLSSADADSEELLEEEELEELEEPEEEVVSPLEQDAIEAIIASSRQTDTTFFILNQLSFLFAAAHPYSRGGPPGYPGLLFLFFFIDTRLTAGWTENRKNRRWRQSCQTTCGIKSLGSNPF